MAQIGPGAASEVHERHLGSVCEMRGKVSHNIRVPRGRISRLAQPQPFP
jgi:hypothetical protein